MLCLAHYPLNHKPHPHRALYWKLSYNTRRSCVAAARICILTSDLEDLQEDYPDATMDDLKYIVRCIKAATPNYAAIDKNAFTTVNDLLEKYNVDPPPVSPNLAR